MPACGMAGGRSLQIGHMFGAGIGVEHQQLFEIIIELPKERLNFALKTRFLAPKRGS